MVKDYTEEKLSAEAQMMQKIAFLEKQLEASVMHNNQQIPSAKPRIGSQESFDGSFHSTP